MARHNSSSLCLSSLSTFSLLASEPAPDNKDMQMRAEAASSGSAPEKIVSLTMAGNKLMCPANCATVAAGYSEACQKA